MQSSEQINELAAALASAQSAFAPVQKTGKNPFFKSRYVTLDGIIEMIRKPLGDNNLSYSQMLSTDDDAYKLHTLLMHSSGQWIGSTIVIPVFGGKGTNELQELGRSITYMKRYVLAAMLGISSDEDNDGNGQNQQAQSQQNPVAKDATWQSSWYEFCKKVEGELPYYKSRNHYINTLRKELATGSDYAFWTTDGRINGDAEAMFLVLVNHAADAKEDEEKTERPT
jgi:hypothetical protein